MFWIYIQDMHNVPLKNYFVVEKNSHNNNSSQSIGVDFLSQVTLQVFFNAPTFNKRYEVQYPDINFHKLTNPKEYVNTIEPTNLIYAEFLY